MPPFVELERPLIAVQLVFAMFGMGATLTLGDFAAVVRDPRGLALGLCVQLLLVPALAVGMIHAFDLGSGWAVGLLLVSVVPGGAFSNMITFLGRGNVPLSISMTAVSTLGCIVTVPTILGILASTQLPAEFAFPVGQVMVDIFAFLLAPLAVGMIAKRASPRRAPAASRWAIRLAVLLLVSITVGALGSGRIQVAEYGWVPPLRIILFGTVVALATQQVCRLFRLYDDDTLALTIEVTIRNVGVALLLIHFFFPQREEQGHVLYSCLFYAGQSMFVAIPAMLRHRAGKSAVLLRAPRPRPAPTREREATT